MVPAEWTDRLIYEEDPNRVSLQFGESKIRYGELAARTAEWNDKLENRGILPGSIVALQLPASFTFIGLLLALWKRGCRVALLDYRLQPAESEELLRLSRSAYRIHASDAKAARLFREELDVTIDAVSSSPAGSAEPHPVDPVLIQFTSASTGRSKVVGRTAGDIRSDIDRAVRAEGSIHRNDRVLVLSSISHTYGLLTAVLPALNQGATLLFSATPQPADVLSAIHGECATVVVGVPFHYELLAHSTRDARPWASVRMALSAGERLNPVARDRMMERYGVAVGQVYGMTEAGILTADFAGRYPGSVGLPLNGVRLAIREGEVYVRLAASPYLLEESAGRFLDGWLRTQDIGEWGGTGGEVLYIRGRTGSVAVVGGLKVNLQEIEETLAGHESVRAALVGIAANGKIEAYLEADDPLEEEALLHWCKERMAAYKIPSALHIVESLPRTATGKLSRRADALSGLRALSTVQGEG